MKWWEEFLVALCRMQASPDPNDRIAAFAIVRGVYILPYALLLLLIVIFTIVKYLVLRK